MKVRLFYFFEPGAKAMELEIPGVKTVTFDPEFLVLKYDDGTFQMPTRHVLSVEYPIKENP